MKIHTITLPTPFEVGDVNIYLINEEPVTLIDVGPKTKEAEAVLRNGLEKHNLKFADIKRIILTHAHEDHCGLAKTIADQARDVEIYIHPWESGHLFGRLSKEEHRQLMFRAGVPDAVFDCMQQLYKSVALLTDAVESNQLIELFDEMELEFASGMLRVLHTPGHTPGSCSFLREADRTMICGDCVIKRITPNPMLAPDPIDPARRFKSLAEYLVSLAKIKSFAPTLIYSGHYEPVTDYEEIFNRYIRSINDRQSKVIDLTTKDGGTAWQVAQKLFPTVTDAGVHHFLAISEAVAHLDYAQSEGKIAVEINNGVEFYRKL